MNTICYIAHESIHDSASHQFLLASGKSLTNTVYINLSEYYQSMGDFNANIELERWSSCERIIFQFQLHWYQAPSILKEWMDKIFDDLSKIETFKRTLQGKEFGIVLIVGSKASNYQLGGRDGVTISELMSPLYAWANFFGLIYLPPFVIYQFQYLNEIEKMKLMIDYGLYLETGKLDSFHDKVNYVLSKLRGLEFQMSEIDHLILDQFIADIEIQFDELNDLYQIRQEG